MFLCCHSSKIILNFYEAIQVILINAVQITLLPFVMFEFKWLDIIVEILLLCGSSDNIECVISKSNLRPTILDFAFTPLPDIFETFSRHIPDIFETFSRHFPDIFHTFSRHICDLMYSRSFEDCLNGNFDVEIVLSSQTKQYVFDNGKL